MGARVAVWVHVEGQVYGPGDEPTAEHAALITNPKVWVDGAAAPSPAAGSGGGPATPMPPGPVWPSTQDDAPAEPDEATAGDTEQPVPPPRGGPGSGVDAWTAYAAAVGVQVDAGAGRDDVIAALDLRCIPTERQ